MSKLFTRAAKPLFYFIVGILFMQNSVATPLCSDLFKTSDSSILKARIHGLSMEVEGVEVTGVSFSEIQKNLDLTTEILQNLKRKKLKVLSLGEGFSQLLPTLLSNGIAAQGLDIWYHSKNIPQNKTLVTKEMQNYQDGHAPKLIRGSALDIPMKSESIDFVVSHNLTYYLHIAEQLRVLTETIRVLSVGGEARILLVHNRKQTENRTLILFKTISDFIDKNYQQTIQFKIVDGLLILSKTDHTVAIDNPIIPFDVNETYETLPNGYKKNHNEQEKRIKENYKLALGYLARHPDDPRIRADIKSLEKEIEYFKQFDLIQKSPWQNWWDTTTSFIVITPAVPKVIK